MSSQIDSDPSNAQVRAQYDNYLIPIWKNPNVPIKRASGCTVKDFEDNEYLDIFSGISVTNVGHTNEAVIVDVGGFHSDMIRIQPPLSINREQLTRTVEGLETTIETEIDA